MDGLLILPLQSKQVAHSARAAGAAIVIIQYLREPACRLRHAIGALDIHPRDLGHFVGHAEYHLLLPELGILLEKFLAGRLFLETG